MEKDMENNTNYSPVYQQSEIIQKIERLGGNYDFASSLSIEDQLFICESLAQGNFASNFQEKNDTEGNVSVKWNDNDTYKRDTSTTLTETKQNAIKELKTFTYRTPPVEIARSLQALFSGYTSKEGHWLYIAQNWNPRAINGVLEGMTKLHTSGRITIQNPPGYFTRLIKFRKKRRSL